MLFYKYLLFFSCLLAAMQGTGQTVELYPSIFISSQPQGGEKELKRMVRQEMQYPVEALKEKVEGSVFINFRVDKAGNVIERYVMNPINTNLEKEALFLFDLILWESNEDKDDGFIQEEKIRFDFSPKKFNRVAQKRGYVDVPQPAKANSTEKYCYNINHVSTKPYLLKYSNMDSFIQENFKYPPIAIQQNIQGKVSAKFIIEKSGKATNISISNPLPGGCNEEMKRLIRLMEWFPSTINGEAVRTSYTYELNFRHPGGIVR